MLSITHVIASLRKNGAGLTVEASEKKRKDDADRFLKVVARAQSGTWFIDRLLLIFTRQVKQTLRESARFTDGLVKVVVRSWEFKIHTTARAGAVQPLSGSKSLCCRTFGRRELHFHHATSVTELMKECRLKTPKSLGSRNIARENDRSTREVRQHP